MTMMWTVVNAKISQLAACNALIDFRSTLAFNLSDFIFAVVFPLTMVLNMYQIHFELLFDYLFIIIFHHFSSTDKDVNILGPNNGCSLRIRMHIENIFRASWHARKIECVGFILQCNSTQFDLWPHIRKIIQNAFFFSLSFSLQVSQRWLLIFHSIYSVGIFHCVD